MRNTRVKNFVLLIVISMISLMSSSQTVIFNESFGTPAATTAISAFTGWSNGVGLTFDQGGAANAADLRNTSTSTGYTGASAGGNVFCTSATERGIGINGIQAASYSNLTLSFGYRKESATALPALQVDFWDGSAWVNVPFTFSQTAAASAAWYLVSGLNLPSTAQINGLKIRFVKTGTTTSVRIDDVKLQGNILAPTALSVSNISSPQTQNVTFSVTVNSLNGSGSALAVTQNTNIVLSTNGNGGNLVGTTSSTINAGSSSVTFTGLTLDGFGSGVTIIATATSGNTLTSATSNTFTVSVAAANDCAGVPGGSALPGTACDDNNPCTINDVWSASCVCSGTIQDTDGDGTCDATDECDNDPNKILAGACGCGNVEVGQTCNDNNACTENDVITACGVCAGTPSADTDNDGTCDVTDQCDNDPNKILAGTCGCGNLEPNTVCDDLNALTTNDVINGSCVCQGLYPVIYFDFSTAAPVSNSIANLASSSITRGNNNGTTNGLLNGTSVSTGYSGVSGGLNAGAAARAGALDLTASTGSAYFEFSLDADQNYSLTITEIKFGSRSTSTGPQTIVLRSSADGYLSDLATTTVLSNSTWALKTLTLSNYSSIPGANVTYRLYGYNGTGSPTTNTTNWRIDDLNIFGYTTFVAPVPIVQFTAPTQTGLEATNSDVLTVTMDIAPASDVVVSVANLGTGTATLSADYAFTTSSLTFTASETYPNSKTVSLSIVNDTDLEPIETIIFGLSISSGTATLGTSTLTYSLSSDDLAQLVINEVDYDMSGSDNAEWVEIKNNGSTAVDINGYKLELVNGGTTPGTVYTTITLATTSTLIQPGGYYVVGNNAATANINLIVTPTTNLIQNGAPDAIGLKDNSNNLLDAVSYEGNTASPYNEGATLNALIDAGSANFVAGTIGRYPDGADTGDNMVDLITLCVGTPGASNTQITSTFYKDFDADTFGNADSTVAACEAPAGYVTNSTDCNDLSSVSNPSAVEICDGLDNDCNLVADNGLVFSNYYLDQDGDGYGSGIPINACKSPGGQFQVGDVGPSGGRIFYDKGNDQGGWRYMELSPIDLSSGAQWGCTNTFIGGTGTSVGSGFQNTLNIVQNCVDLNTAAHLCLDYSIASYSDWFLPSQEEWALIYNNLQVPGIVNFETGVGNQWNRYWTSSESWIYANAQDFTPYYQQIVEKNWMARVRAARRFAGYVMNNTDCDDAMAAINPGASEICDGLDNDCSAGADNSLSFVNYYNDVDGDTYGSGTATNACQSPGASYVTNNTDCNDASSSVNAVQNWYADGDMDGYDVMIVNACNSPGPAFTTNAGIYGMGDCNDALSSVNPGATEVCGNGIDDDCNAGDLVCPVSPFEAALNIVNIGQFGTGPQATQSVNLATGTNSVQSPGLGLDKWFKFTATSNAVRIAVTGHSTIADDNDLSLYETPTDATVQLIPIASENDVHPGDQGLATDGGNETLIYDQLMVGDVYYLCVRNNNNTAGNVSLIVSNLNASTTDIALYTNGTNTFTSSCQNFKVKFRPNAGEYTINRWSSTDISGTPTWSYTIPVTSSVSSTVCQLGKIAPANLTGSNQTVYVTVDVLYNLKDAYGTVTPAAARGIAAASFQMASESDLNVRTTDRCAAGFKSTTSSIATNRSVCGTTRYVWEMTMVYPQSALPLEVQGPLGGSRVLMMNTVPAIANGQRYDVRIASKHVDGTTLTAFGTTQCVKTLGAAGMPTIEEEINVYERSENGITATIYPNPNNGQTVNFGITGFEGALNVKVTDTRGRAVYNNQFSVEGAMNTTLDFGQTLADGVYMVELLQNGELKTMRMVVSK